MISSDGACFGDSSSVELSEEEELLAAILEKKLERTGVDGTLFEEVLEGVFFEDDTLFEDSVLDGLGLDGVSLSLSFDDELFEVFVFKDSVFDGLGDFAGSVLDDFGDLGGSVFDRESFGGATSGNAPICVAILVGVGFDDEAFAGAGFGAATFGDSGFAGAAFGDGGFAAAATFDVLFGMVTFGGGSLT